MVENKVAKRQGGQFAENGTWLVLEESTPVMEEDELKGWKHSCGEVIMTFTDYRPIWDGPFPTSGSGRVHREAIPYCPKCEEKPISQGPIDLRKAIWGDIGED